MSNDINRSSIISSNRRLSRRDSFLNSSNHFTSQSTINPLQPQNDIVSTTQALTANVNASLMQKSNSNNFKTNSKIQLMSNSHESKRIKKVQNLSEKSR